MFNGTSLTLNSDVDLDTYEMLVSHERSLTYRCIDSEYIQIKINEKKGINKDKVSTVHITEYQRKRNQRVKPRCQESV